MQEEEQSDELKEKEYDVVLVEDENGEKKVKVIEAEYIGQFKDTLKYSEGMKKLILYSKIAAGISLFCLIVALTFIGIISTSDVISNLDQKVKYMSVSMSLFVTGLCTYLLALHLDKKSKRIKPRTKKKTSKKPKQKSKAKKKKR